MRAGSSKRRTVDQIDDNDPVELDIDSVLSTVRRALDDFVAPDVARTGKTGVNAGEDTARLSPQMRSVLEMVQETDVRELAAQRGLTSALESLVSELERRVLPYAPQEPGPGVGSGVGSDLGGGTSGFASSTKRSIQLLHDAMQLNPPRIAPELDPAAPLGHSYPFASERLEADVETTLATLEDLADLGLLQRTLANRVHLCPSCERCQINFREQCTRCSSIDLSIERVLHHFRCGYIGIESEFRSGRDLVCPKCRRDLHQLGQDFDRPHETYVCRDCSTLMEEPVLSGQCLSCSLEFPAHEAEQRAIHAYVPTPLAMRAIELGRLTGLDVDAILYDAELKIATRDFLDFEIKRELIRLKRNTSAFSTALLSFERRGRHVPIFRHWSAAALRDLCSTLAGSLRVLDLVTRLDAGRIGILMPEADQAGAEVVRERLFRLLQEIEFVDHGGNRLIPVWTVATWDHEDVAFDHVQEFLGPADP
ncbi:MAG: hypothetical protein AAF957_20885 [Planctomycetota bacterium]